jgi:purine nucleoside permease
MPEVKFLTLNTVLVKAKFLSHSPNFGIVKSFGGWGGIPTVDPKGDTVGSAKLCVTD